MKGVVVGLGVLLVSPVPDGVVELPVGGGSPPAAGGSPAGAVPLVYVPFVVGYVPVGDLYVG